MLVLATMYFHNIPFSKTPYSVTGSNLDHRVRVDSSHLSPSSFFLPNLHFLIHQQLHQQTLQPSRSPRLSSSVLLHSGQRCHTQTKFTQPSIPLIMVTDAVTLVATSILVLGCDEDRISAVLNNNIPSVGGGHITNFTHDYVKETMSYAKKNQPKWYEDLQD